MFDESNVEDEKRLGERLRAVSFPEGFLDRLNQIPVSDLNTEPESQPVTFQGESPTVDRRHNRLAVILATAVCIFGVGLATLFYFPNTKEQHGETIKIAIPDSEFPVAHSGETFEDLEGKIQRLQERIHLVHLRQDLADAFEETRLAFALTGEGEGSVDFQRERNACSMLEATKLASRLGAGNVATKKGFRKVIDSFSQTKAAAVAKSYFK